MKDGVERLDAADEAGAEQAARLHAELLPGSPVARLGQRFMRRFYYRSLIADDLIHCDLAYVDGKAAGFIAYTAQPARFMGEGLRRHWFFLGGLLLWDVLTDPRRISLIFWTLNFMRRRPGAVPETGEGEILSFGVAPECRSSKFIRLTGRRIPVELFARARNYFRAQGISRYRAVVTVENREALMFYHAQGCRIDANRASAPGTMLIVCQTTDEPEGADRTDKAGEVQNR